jgi:diadenosine tetraphosphate (Ap4A) HIT family hydrolase
LPTDWRLDRIGAAELGENPTVIARMKSGFAVMGDTQFLPGYCVLLAVPQVTHLSDLTFAQRRDFLLDMSLLREAIEQVFRPRRTNYEILGNTDAYVHAHVWARYEWEPRQYIGGPVWRYPKETRFDQAQAFSLEEHSHLKQGIASALMELTKRAV